MDDKRARFDALAKLHEHLGPLRNFDGGSALHLPFMLDDEVTVLDTAVPPHFPRVKVRLSYKRNDSLEGDMACDFYNKLFRRIMRELKFVQMNKGSYDPKRAIAIPELRLEIWPGFVTNVHEKEGGLMLNCDISHRVLRSQTVLQLLSDAYKMACRKIKEGDSYADYRREVARMLIGEVVLTRYNNKFYRIDDIDWVLNPRSTFPNSSGEDVRYV